MDTNMSRRRFLQVSAIAAGATMIPLPVRWLGTSDAQAFANSPALLKARAGALRGLSLPPKVLGLIPNTAFAANDPAGIPCLDPVPDPVFANTNLYNITIGEFTDTLHQDLGPTRLWGYKDSAAANQRHLGGVIIAARGTASRLRFTNTLPQRHIIPVDTTLPGANQAQNRVAVHLHGGYIPWTSDGGPFDWWDPAGASGLSFINGPGGFLDALYPAGQKLTAGQADYYYPNDQSTRLMWYHDHAHGITRINAYAGIATAYLCLDLTQEGQLLNAPAVTSLIPLVFQDKIFVNGTPGAGGAAGTGTYATDPTWSLVARADCQPPGSLWYAHVYDPKLYRLRRNMLPPPNPSCVPEFFGDTMLCNGTVTPLVTLEAKRYRIMILNANNARFMNLNLVEVQPGCEVVTDPKTGLPISQYNYLTNTPVAAPPLPGPQMIQIGTEGGYLQQPVVWPPAGAVLTNGVVPFNPATFTGNLILGNAERADLIIDFTGKAGKEFVFYNDSPGPFPAGAPSNDYFAGNPATPAAVLGGTLDTRNVIRFKIVAAAVADQQIGLPTLPAMDPPALAGAPVITNGVVAPLGVPVGTFIRDLTLNEDFDTYGRLLQRLGTTKPALIGKGFGMDYLAAPTEVIPQGKTEVWRVFNTTADTHPIHFHLQTCQIISRQPFKIINGIFTPTGAARGPELNELGWKETVKMHPGELTTVIFKWDQPAVPFTVPTSPRATLTVNGAQTNGTGMGLPAGTIYNEFVWHCHILEHEEHDMMRPLIITGQAPQRPNVQPTGGAIALGATQVFTVTLPPASAGFTVTTNVGAPAPSGFTTTSFTVTFLAPGTYTYTVKDSTSNLTSSVTVNVA